MQTIYLDISNKGLIPTIHAKQGDVGRKFLAVLTDTGIPYMPLPGSVFSIWYEGVSGDGNYTEIGDKSAFSLDGNKITVELIAQMLAVPGDGVLCLVLNGSDGSQIASWNISYSVESVPGVDSDVAKDYYTAFSHAVSNLPYPDASLSVAGKAADAAATGAALAGKAPAGYGLGGDCNNIDSVLNIDKNGWWVTNVDTPDGDYWKCFSQCINNGADVTVDACNYAGTLKATRTKVAGVWGEWEWINPPMYPSEEYRTTERWDGKPLYTTLIPCGSISAGGGYFEYNTGYKVVRWDGTVGDFSLPVRLNGSETSGWFCDLGVGSGRIYYNAGSAFDNAQLTVRLWYVKE